MIRTSDDILAFWFDTCTPEDWFTKSTDFDARVAQQFSDTYDAAVGGSLDNWQETPLGALALVIVLDQFPRNMFRDSERSFGSDAEALAVTRAALARGDDTDTSYTDHHRQFLYMPLMHSEDEEDQKTCVELAEQRTENELLQDFARQHLRVVERFGRFPHRNALLGRKSTAEEIEFLKQDGSSF